MFVILCGFFIIGYSAFCDSDNDEDQADISSKVGNLVGQMEVSGGEHDYLEGMIGNGLYLCCWSTRSSWWSGK
jgi:hypothetical protein